MSRIGDYLRRQRREARSPGAQRVRMKFDIPPETLRAQGLETKESVPVTVEMEVPKDARPAKPEKEEG